MEQVLTKIMDKLQVSRERLIQKQQVEALFPLKQPGIFSYAVSRRKEKAMGKRKGRK